MKENIINIITKWTTSDANTLADTVKSIMKFETTDASAVQGLVDLFIPLAFALMACYFLMACIKEAQSSPDNTKEIIIRNFLYLIIADLFLNNVNLIIGSLMGLSNNVMDSIANIFTTDSATISDDMKANIDAFQQSLGDQTLWALIVIFIVAFFAHLMTMAATIVVGITCLSQKLQLDIKLAWAPIGMSSIAEAGMGSSRATNYVKSLLATTFYAGAMVAIIYMVYQINGMDIATGSSGTDGLEGAGIVLDYAAMNIVKPFAAIGALGTAKTVVNDAFGVNG